MGSGQRFHLPAALKRTKSKAPNHGWQPEGNEYKVQHLLGITETDFNTARNQSISSSATAKLPALSFSDATTELGSSHPPTEHLDAGTDLNLKASSVLLHEEFLLTADGAGSTNPKRLKTYGSSSTINSYYDAYKAPLAVSQQTSESSRRDFALRKGAPVVIKSTTPDKDSLRQLKLFRLSRSDNKQETKKLTKPNSQSGDPNVKMLFGSPRSARSSDQTRTARHLDTNPQSKTQKGVRFQSDHSAASINAEKAKQSSARPSRQDTPYVKMNIRRPKAGAKHWFDGLEGDSSDDESVHEPELHPSFVAGMEMAFEGDRIGLLTNEGARMRTHTPETSSRGTSSKAPSSHLLPLSAIPARVSTLNAKSSRSTLSRNESQQTSSKPKASSLASTNLHKTSILDLSSSDDDDDRLRPLAQGRESGSASLPLLRDSIAVESLADSEIEVGTAKAVSTKQNVTSRATPSLRRVHGAHARSPASSLSKPSNKRRNHRSTYLSDLSSNPTPEDDDLLTSFPATPTDQASSHRPSFHESCLSDTASIESRRLMSVTRQEESLLAAIRSRKTALGQPSGAGGAADRRIQVLRDMEKKSSKHQRPPRNSAALEVQLTLQRRTQELLQSPYSDANFDQASCTTFQTGQSTEPSARYSLASFHTGTSIEPETEMSSSLATFSPTLLAPSNSAVNRMSRSTFFSTSTNSSRDNSRNRRESHYLATLEKLQATPKREDVSSQDFIDFPYNGWMKLAAAAH